MHMCKVFLEYLKQYAIDWFNEVPKNNISFFRELASAFFNRFFQKPRGTHASVDILNVHEYKGESLTE